MTKRRRAAVASGLIALLIVVGAAAQWEIARRLETGFREELAKGENDGSFESVSVCLPCLSYTIHAVDLRRGGTSDTRMRSHLVVDRVEVGLDVSRLLGGALRGYIELPNATLHLDDGHRDEGERSGDESLQIGWDTLGRGLFPFPYDRIESRGSEVIFEYEQSAEPVEWRFEVDSGLLTNLAIADGAPRASVRGTTPGSGAFEFVYEVQQREPPESAFRGFLRGVQLEALDGYLRERFGIDVERGEASAAIDLAVTNTGWTGTVDMQVANLEIFETADLFESGPIQAATDGVAEVVARMRRDEHGVLDVRLEIDERVQQGDSSAAWPWTVATRLVEWIFLAPLELPRQLGAMDSN